MTIPHIMLVQSCYTDPQLSVRRLEISRATVIPSLRYQTRKPIVHVVVNPDDTLTQERIAAFASTGCEVVPIERPSWSLYGEDWQLPGGRKLISRVDDDDAICVDFCEVMFQAAQSFNEVALVWPVGNVLWRGKTYQLIHRANQFVSLVTSKQNDPHQECHLRIVRRWPTQPVGKGSGWLWVRHGDAYSSTLPKYRQVRARLDARRFPLSLQAIQRAIEPSGIPSANYREHNAPVST